MTTKVIICGAAGRMGRALVRLAQEAPEFAVVGAVEAPAATALGRDAGDVAGVGHIGVPIQGHYDADPGAVTLDFTQADAAVEHLRAAVAQRAPIVIGATGFSAAQQAEIDRLAPGTRSVIAPNMSVGITVLMTLVRAAARALADDFDPEIVEIHHRLKVDSPSGTARALASAIAGELQRDLRQHGVYGREGILGPRPDEEIGVMALRGGDAVGDHTVLFIGAGERLELTHRAQSRDCLARGALRAAKWLARQSQPGRYTMADVLAPA